MTQNLKFKVVTYLKGVVMSTDACYDWLEADNIAEERIQHPALCDEVRIINVEDTRE